MIWEVRIFMPRGDTYTLQRFSNPSAAESCINDFQKANEYMDELGVRWLDFDPTDDGYEEFRDKFQAALEKFKKHFGRSWIPLAR